MQWKSPVIMIGIDAATWDVMQPLLDTGRLPHIARLMEQGCSGTLRSFTGYVSPSLWTSITTGKVPEKHGVLDFFSATRLNIQCKTLYDIIGGEQRRFGLFRWFASWPPDVNHGFTVPDSIARSPETHPTSLQFLNDLLRPTGIGSYLSGGVQLLRHRIRPTTLSRAILTVAREVISRPDQREAWYRRRLVESAIYADVFAELLRRHQPDFAAILLYHTDDIGHKYWRYREPECFGDVTASEISTYGDVIDKGYIEADRAVGRILKVTPDDALVIVVSDHGQQVGTAEDSAFRMSPELLVRLGLSNDVWLTFIGYSAFLRMRSESADPSRLQDLSSLLAQIRVNSDGEPVFSVSMPDPLQLVVNVRDIAPSHASQTVTWPGGQSARLDELIFSDGRLSGIHSDRGILVVKGSGVRKGHQFDHATILDVTPTVLALRGLPVARDMDGTIIEDMFEDGFIERNPIRTIDTYGIAGDRELIPAFADGELAELESRLRDLGYL